MANEDHLVFPGEFDDIYDRRPALPTVDRVWARESAFAQGAEFNEAFSIAEEQARAIGNLSARDGDRLEGSDIIVNADDEEVTLAAGVIYVRGKPRKVIAAVLEEVPMEGDVQIGVRLTSTTIDHEENPLLLGLHEGALSHGEGGAIRETLAIAWAWGGDEADGDFYPVYFLRDGTVVDQTPPPNLTGIQQAISLYDFDAHENYIVRGCEVTALGAVGDDQAFSIAAGVANILGFKRTRLTDSRFTEEELPDLATVDAEAHTFADPDAGVATIALRRTPVASILSAIVTKEVTETIVKGVSNGSDNLTNTGVTQIISVVKGMTTYVPTTDYVRSGDAVSWAPGGAEPSPGESYDVTYRYLDAVAPSALTAVDVALAGGVEDEPVIISYTYKLPRVDRICFDREGLLVYLKGLSVADQPQPPKVPSSLLALAEIHNDWFGKPTVVNNGTRSYPFSKIDRMYNRLVDLYALMGIERLQRRADARAEAAKRGVFVDPFEDDALRDGGVAQTAAVFNGSCQIAIDPTFHPINLTGPQFLAFTETFVIRQELVTGCMKINPYQSFAPLPAKMTLTPASDFWTEQQTNWASDATRVFGQGNTSRVASTQVISSTRNISARFLREIEVSFRIEGFGEGETLDELIFSGIDVTPAGPLEGDENGIVEGSFDIPANVAAGSKLVTALGGSGMRCAAMFTGEGLIEITTLQRVINVELFTPPTEPARVFGTDPWEFMGRGGDGPAPDPLAQSFSLPFSQHVTGIDVKFCAIGDPNEPVICEIVAMENGLPTTTVIAQTEISMVGVLAGAWTLFSFLVPVFLPSSRQFAFVFKTNDPDHSLSIARRGGFDAASQAWVSAQPYTVGVLFSSSNAISWTPHQDEDLVMRVRAARFAPTSRTIDLGTFAASDVSDVLVRANIMLPTDDARVRFEVKAGSEDAILLEPDQVWERTSFTDDDINIKAILTGSEFISPILGRDLLAIFGTMQASGTYVTRKFEMGADVRIDAVMGTKLPTGSTITVEKDAGDGDWESLPETVARVLGDGWVERTYSDASFDAPTGGRVKITITGTPAARPSVRDLEAFSI